MSKIILDNDISLEINKIRTDKETLNNFLGKLPIQIVLFDKYNTKYNHLSSRDNITNIKDFKRTYNAKTYILLSLNINDDNIKYSTDDYNTMICISRRYIRSNYNKLKLSKSSIVNEYGEKMCQEFIDKTLPCLLKNEHYHVTLYKGDEISSYEDIFYEKKEDVIKYLIERRYFSDEINNKLLCEI